jgi:hypothetical protein
MRNRGEYGYKEKGGVGWRHCDEHGSRAFFGPERGEAKAMKHM